MREDSRLGAGWWITGFTLAGMVGLGLWLHGIPGVSFATRGIETAAVDDEALADSGVEEPISAGSAGDASFDADVFANQTEPEPDSAMEPVESAEAASPSIVDSVSSRGIDFTTTLPATVTPQAADVDPPGLTRVDEVPDWAFGPVPASAGGSASTQRKLPRVDAAILERDGQVGAKYSRSNGVQLASEPPEEPASAAPRRLATSEGTRLPKPSSAGVEEPAVEVPVNEDSAGPSDEIDRKLAGGETLSALKLISKIYWSEPDRRAEFEDRLTRAAGMVFFSPQQHYIDPYVIQPNDQLSKVAASHKLTWQYLARLNKTDPRRIQPGKKLKVHKGPFAAVVELDRFALTVHLQGYVVKAYPVGIGKDGSSPIGTFPVLNKVENPQYTGPDGKVIAGDDPANPLGERWIDLGDGYGIHGTIEPDSIGKSASRGCIRMRDADVAELYDFLVLGSEVVIRH